MISPFSFFENERMYLKISYFVKMNEELCKCRAHVKFYNVLLQ